MNSCVKTSLSRRCVWYLFCVVFEMFSRTCSQVKVMALGRPGCLTWARPGIVVEDVYAPS